MEICIKRNYRNLVPNETVKYDHAVFMINKSKDDLFLCVLNKYERCSNQVTILLSCKITKQGALYQNRLESQYFSSKINEQVQVISNARMFIEKYYTAKKRPSIVVTDDDSSEELLSKFCPQYYNVSSQSFRQLNINANIEALCLFHPIDLSKFDYQLNLFNCKNIKYKTCVRSIIPILPPCFIFFTAFGDYNLQHRFQEVLNAFMLFKYKHDQRFAHEIFLVLGGDYFVPGSIECKNRSFLKASLEKIKKDHNVIFLKKTLSTSEKKTLLRLSYVAIYLNNDSNCKDLKFAMSLGTPIICSNIGRAANMVTHGCTGFVLDTHRIDHIATCMEKIALPTVYQKLSKAARQVYLKNFSETSYVLQTIDIKDVPNFTTPKKTANVGVLCTLAVCTESYEPVNNMNIQNNWLVPTKYVQKNKNRTIFENDPKHTEQGNNTQICVQNVPQETQSYMAPNTETLQESSINYNTSSQWIKNNEVYNQMCGNNLTQMVPVQEIPIEQFSSAPTFTNVEGIRNDNRRQLVPFDPNWNAHINNILMNRSNEMQGMQMHQSNISSNILRQFTQSFQAKQSLQNEPIQPFQASSRKNNKPYQNKSKLTFEPIKHKTLSGPNFNSIQQYRTPSGQLYRLIKTHNTSWGKMHKLLELNKTPDHQEDIQPNQASFTQQIVQPDEASNDQHCKPKSVQAPNEQELQLFKVNRNPGSQNQQSIQSSESSVNQNQQGIQSHETSNNYEGSQLFIPSEQTFHPNQQYPTNKSNLPYQISSKQYHQLYEPYIIADVQSIEPLQSYGTQGIQNHQLFQSNQSQAELNNQPMQYNQFSYEQNRQALSSKSERFIQPNRSSGEQNEQLFVPNENSDEQDQHPFQPQQNPGQNNQQYFRSYKSSNEDGQQSLEEYDSSNKRNKQLMQPHKPEKQENVDSSQSSRIEYNNVPALVEEPYFGNEHTTSAIIDLDNVWPSDAEIADFCSENPDEDWNDVFQNTEQNWQEVFANDSLAEYSMAGSELSETREVPWSGLSTDDSPSTEKSWFVLNSSHLSQNTQNSEDIWVEANQDSETRYYSDNEDIEIPSQIEGYFDNADPNNENNSSSIRDEEQAQKEEEICKNGQEEEGIINKLNAKVDVKLDNNQGIDTNAPKRSKHAKRKAKKRRLKKLQQANK